MKNKTVFCYSNEMMTKKIYFSSFSSNTNLVKIPINSLTFRIVFQFKCETEQIENASSKKGEDIDKILYVHVQYYEREQSSIFLKKLS